MNFDITASQDCYIYLFDIETNGNVQLIIPNDSIETAFYNKEDEGERLKEEIDKLDFSVYLPDGKEQSGEILYLNNPHSTYTAA